MSDLFQQESPLVQIDLEATPGNGLTISEKPFLGFLNLRGKSNNTGFQASTLKLLGCEPPTEANTMLEAGDNRIYWLGPDEWLIVTPVGQQTALQQSLSKALDKVFAAVVDNSSGLTMLEIEGENAAALLATDCPLDLHASQFKSGQCAQTRLAKAGMIIAPMRKGTGFEVIIRRSFGDYLLHWMQEAAIAFRLPG
jgi:sarcosine oxidase subunit gamma